MEQARGGDVADQRPDRRGAGNTQSCRLGLAHHRIAHAQFLAQISELVESIVTTIGGDRGGIGLPKVQTDDGGYPAILHLR